MAIKYASPPREGSVHDLTNEEIKQWFRGMADSEILRSILIAEIRAIQGGAEREQRTMRGLWYDTVKPLLSRAGILNKLTSGGKPVRWDGKLSKYLAELVRAEFTTYEELGIIDGSRNRQPARLIQTGVIDVPLIGGHFPWVILFTEKDTIWGVVKALADLYGVSAISGGGEPSYACTENILREIVRSDAFQRVQPDHLILLALTDYDPFGYKIADAQYTQMAEIAHLIPEVSQYIQDVEFDRIGVFPDQLDEADRFANAYEPKEIGLDDWFYETGGVDGERLGIELDALPLSRLRALFADGIERNIDLELKRNDLRNAYLDLIACDLLEDEFNARREAMIEAVQDSDLWDEIQDHEIVDDFFKKFATAGWGWITPSKTKEFFEGYQDRVEDIMERADNEYQKE